MAKSQSVNTDGGQKETMNLPGATIKRFNTHDNGNEYLTLDVEDDAELPYIVGQLENKEFVLLDVTFDEREIQFIRYD